jgi:periplasmic divalent cation tolerance protein
MQSALLVFTNLPDVPTAQALAQQLVASRLVACVNILPAVESIYRWQDVVEQASEVTLLIKTVAARYDEVEAAIRAAHPYQVPEIIGVPIVAGLPAYLHWLTTETRKDFDV